MGRLERLRAGRGLAHHRPAALGKLGANAPVRGRRARPRRRHHPLQTRRGLGRAPPGPGRLQLPGRARRRGPALGLRRPPGPAPGGRGRHDPGGLRGPGVGARCGRRTGAGPLAGPAPERLPDPHRPARRRRHRPPDHRHRCTGGGKRRQRGLGRRPGAGARRRAPHAHHGLVPRYQAPPADRHRRRRARPLTLPD